MQVVLLSSRGARLMDLPDLYPNVRVYDMVPPMSTFGASFSATSRPKYREFDRLDRCSYEEKE